MENTGYYKILSSISNTTGLKQITIDGENIDFTPFIHIVVDSDVLYSNDFNFNFSNNDLYSCISPSNNIAYIFKHDKENNSRVSYFFDSIPAYKKYPLAFCYNTENSVNEEKKIEINAKTLYFGSISTELKFNSIKNSSKINFSSKSIQVNSLSSILASSNVDINSLSGVVNSHEFSGYSAKELGFVIDDTNNNKLSHKTDNNLEEDIFIIKKNNKYIISPIEGKEIDETITKTYFGFAINLEEFSEINDGTNGVMIEALSSGHTKIYCDELVEIGE